MGNREFVRKRSLRTGVLFVLVMLGLNAPAFGQAVGSTSGTFQVTPNGTASYSIPITVPPGVAGLAPKLSIDYDSQADNSFMGQGFAVSGLSSITRCPATYATDNYKHGVDFSAQDRFCLDGQRLVAINGTYGAVGTEYRTEVESFSRIVSENGENADPGSFHVLTKSGLIMDYGATADSRETAQGKTQALTWHVNRIADTAGNFISITYNQNANTGETVPATITYGGNSRAGTAANTTITFNYAARPDPNTAYVSGSAITQAQLLTSLTTFVGSHVARSYRFAYDTLGLMGRSRLTSVTECGSDGTCFNPTTFSWIGHPGTSTPGWNSQAPSSGPAENFPANNQCFSGDLNGDGRTDMWCEPSGSSQNWQVFLSTVTGDWQQESWTGPGLAQSSTSTCMTGDLNGDGLTDMWCQGTGQNWNIYLSTGSGWDVRTWSWVQLTGLASGLCFTGDLNGDGRADTWCRADTSGDWQVAISTGIGWNTYIWQGINPQDPSQTTQQCYAADVNGDGMTDTLCETGSSTGSWTVALSTGSGWNLQTWNSGPAPTLQSAQCQQGDINGDGLPDLWCMADNSGDWNVALSTGAGWVMSRWHGITVQDPNDMNKQCATGDLNGDGRADMWCETGNSTGQWSVALSTGSGWEVSTWSGPAPGLQSNQCLQGDSNGDGLPDMWCESASGSGKWTFWKAPAIAPDVVNTITSGIGAQVILDYQLLTSPLVYTKGSGTYPAVYPDMDVEAPAYVVSDEFVSDGIGGLHHTSYNYSGEQFDFIGRGSLGFGTIAQHDLTTGITKTTTYEQLFPEIGMVNSTETHVTSSNAKIADSSFILSYVTLSRPQGSTYFPYVATQYDETYEINIENVVTTVTVTQNTYGEPASNFFGNLTQSTVSTYAGAVGSSAPFVTTNNNTYTNDTANWFLGRLTQSTVTKQNPSGFTATRTSAFTYDPNTGLLASETVEPNDTTNLYLRTSYTRDTFGNVVAKTVHGAGFADRTTRTVFDAQGQFPLQTINSLNHTLTRIYEPLNGNVLTAKDANGLVVTDSYDGFGRKVSEQRPDATTTVSRYWCSNGSCNPSNAVFRIETDTPGRPDTSVAYDLNEREVSRFKSGWDGQWVGVFTEYNSLGQVAATSSPAFAPLTGFTSGAFDHYYSYDAMGRLISTREPTGRLGSGIESTNYFGLQTTHYDLNGHSSVHVTDAIGETIAIHDNEYNTTQFTYDAFGNLLTTTDPKGNVIASTYDLRGRKLTQADPDMGTWSYTYDALGEVLTQTNANQQTVTMTYDPLGRMLTRLDGYEGVTTAWTYDTVWKGALTSVSMPAYQRSYQYDSLGRPALVDYNIFGTDYTYAYQYDGLGRLSELTDPKNFSVRYQYDYYGMPISIGNASAGTLVWQANDADAFGHVTSATLGNGENVTHIYDPQTGRPIYIQASGTTPVQNVTYTWDPVGNLLTRQESTIPATESFQYDDLNRLTFSSVNVDATGSNTDISISYDSIGNIASRSDVGTYSYNSGHPHAVSSITNSSNNRNSSYTYDSNGNELSSSSRTMVWSSFNLPTQISESGTTVNWVYGPDREMLNENAQLFNGAYQENTTFVGGGLEIHANGGVQQYRHNIQVNGETVAYVNETPAVTLPVGGTVNTSSLSAATTYTRYLHYDQRGSVVAVTDEKGLLSEQLAYDAFGKRRLVNWLNDPTDTMLAVPHQTNWGFGDHLHMDEVALIHMGGRVYDPVIGRFTSADDVIPFPDNDQSYNRYSYVLNNPLSLTDPTGHWPHWHAHHWFHSFSNELARIERQSRHEIRRQGSWWPYLLQVGALYLDANCAYGAAVCGVATQVALTRAEGGSDRDALKAGGIAAFTAGAMYGVGFVQDPILNAVGHGAVGGIASYAGGGKFGAGFAGGLVSGAFDPEAEKLTNQYGVGAGAALEGVVGGTSSVLAGGKFGNGAVTGAFGYLFNWMAHKTDGKLWAGQPTADEYAAHYADMTGEDVYRLGSDVNLSAYPAGAFDSPAGKYFYAIASPGTLASGLMSWELGTLQAGPQTDAFIYGSLNNIQSLGGGYVQLGPDRFNFDMEGRPLRDFMTWIQSMTLGRGLPGRSFRTIFVGPTKIPGN